MPLAVIIPLSVENSTEEMVDMYFMYGEHKVIRIWLVDYMTKLTQVEDGLVKGMFATIHQSL